MRSWMKLTGCMVVVVAIGCAKTDYSTGCADDQTTCVDYEGGVDSSADETSVDSGRDTNVDTRDSSGEVGDVSETGVDADAGDSRDSCTPIACPATACGSLDDGCGGKLTCPDCPSGKTCDTGTHTCVCKPITACPAGLDCGNVPDGCGGTFACATCTGGKTCNTTTNKCETTCTPATTCPSGKCGDIDNGCGTGTLHCGGCTSPASCGGGGTTGICGCTPTGTCGTRNCGSVPDGCGGTINCGSLGGGCPGGQTCNSGGTCVCVPTGSCGARNCNTVPDGCGSTITCGTLGGGCPSGQTCGGGGTTGVCGCTPTWSCTGKCGTITDSCGGTHDCGGCTAPKTCGGGGTANVCGGCGGTLPGPAMVNIGGHCIDSTEVTQAQYQAFLFAKSGDVSGQTTRMGCNTANSSFAPNTSTICAGNFAPASKPNRPVACVDWCDASAYCSWAGKNLCGAVGGGGVDFASPVPLQWMEACTNGSTTTYPYGNTYSSGQCNNTSSGVVDVSSFSACHGVAAPYSGVFDLSGNVGEWLDLCSPSSGQCRYTSAYDAGSNGGTVEDDSGCRSGGYDSPAMYTLPAAGFRCCAF